MAEWSDEREPPNETRPTNRWRIGLRVCLLGSLAAALTAFAGINGHADCNEPLWASWTIPMFFVAAGLADFCLLFAALLRTRGEALIAFLLIGVCYGLYSLLVLAGLPDSC
jgi:hypothetical protein